MFVALSAAKFGLHLAGLLIPFISTSAFSVAARSVPASLFSHVRRRYLALFACSTVRLVSYGLFCCHCCYRYPYCTSPPVLLILLPLVHTVRLWELLGLSSGLPALRQRRFRGQLGPAPELQPGRLSNGLCYCMGPDQVGRTPTMGSYCRRG